jgi:hypothetical protein
MILDAIFDGLFAALPTWLQIALCSIGVGLMAIVAFMAFSEFLVGEPS